MQTVPATGRRYESLFDRYRDRGGEVREHAWEGVGHSPHLERVEEFAAIIEALRSDR